MNTFTIVVFCIQICLLKNTFGQCIGSSGPGLLPNGYGPGAPFNYPNGFPDAYPGTGWSGPFDFPASYGGTGDGNVAVAGDLPVSGTTIITGQIPILGAVSFAGPIPAIGTVLISGNCACGCTGSPHYNMY